MTVNSLESTISPRYHSQNTTLVQKIRQLLSYWYWFAISTAICLVGGFTFLRYSTAKYEVNATILVKDDTKGTDLGEAALLENLGLNPGKSNVDNEVEILKSRTLMESVVKDLQLYVEYFATGHVKTTEIYKKSPFRLTILEPAKNSSNRTETYFLTFDKDGFTLTDNVHTWHSTFGDTLTLYNTAAVLNRTKYKPAEDDKYSIQIIGFDQAVTKYSNELSVSATNKLVSIINLKVTEILPEKGEAILKKLIENYLHASITDKNRIADSTVAFIDQNIKLVSEELTGVEKQIEGFRTKNQLTDIKEQTRLLLGNTSANHKERIANEVKLKVIGSLLEFINENPARIIPSSIIMQEPDFIAMIEKYNVMLMTCDRESMSYNGEHPSIQNLESQLKRIRQDLIINIESKKKEIQLNIIELDKYAFDFKAKINQVPAKERIFFDYARKQEIKQELYLFLLKKRIETSISKSSTLANGRIIDPAKADQIPITPNSQLTIIVAVLLGLSLPALTLYVRDIFNTKITGKTDLQSSTHIPIIAEIGHKESQEINVIGNKKGRHIAEQFRTFRTNLQFLSAVNKDQVILVTSSMGGEGKTFIAVNLCTTLRLTDKKVILIEFDLRKPKIAGHLNLDGQGLTDYIISDIPLKNIIQQAGVSGQFDVIISGPIPPNPAELILSPKIDHMFSTLKENYDYIILDTAPLGLVTDARLLSQYVNITLFVIRQKFTFRHQLEAIEELSSTNQLPKLHLLLNDVKALPGYGYSYGYDNK